MIVPQWFLVCVSGYCQPVSSISIRLSVNPLFYKGVTVSGDVFWGYYPFRFGVDADPVADCGRRFLNAIDKSSLSIEARKQPNALRIRPQRLASLHGPHDRCHFPRL